MKNLYVRDAAERRVKKKAYCIRITSAETNIHTVINTNSRCTFTFILYIMEIVKKMNKRMADSESKNIHLLKFKKKTCTENKF